MLVVLFKLCLTLTHSVLKCVVFFFFFLQNADFQSLGQIEICFDPDFTLMDCEKRESKGDWGSPLAVDKASELSVCDHNTPVYYPPLQ